MVDSSPAFVFRLNENGQGPDILRQAFLEKGWVEYDENEQDEYDWNLWWKTSRFRQCDHDQVMPWQRLNHYPKATAITKKDSLARNLKRMKSVHGPVYNFSPIAFNLPNDYTKFVSEYSRLKDNNTNKVFWICKPADSSRGRGIFIFKDLGELQYDFNAVVQQYISTPLLISGYKFDLRIYVLVTSFHPLNIFIYSEGLVRFSTEKFDLSSLKNVFSHLTNTSINKNSPSYSTDKDRIGPGCKWTLTQFRHYIRQIGVNDAHLFGKIINIVTLTLVVQAQQVPKVLNCCELYGFDILIDSNWKPWLLEVNFSPALSADTTVDFLVKKPMLYDLIDVLSFSDKDRERGGKEYHNEQVQAKQRMDMLYPSYVPPTVGGRKFTIGGNLKKKAAHPSMQNSPKKLPSISANYCNTNKFECSNKENLEDIANVAEQQVIRLVPGCGLPSVQQPNIQLIEKMENDSISSDQQSSEDECCPDRNQFDQCVKSSSAFAINCTNENSCNSNSSTSVNQAGCQEMHKTSVSNNSIVLDSLIPCKTKSHDSSPLMASNNLHCQSHSATDTIQDITYNQKTPHGKAKKKLNHINYRAASNTKRNDFSSNERNAKMDTGMETASTFSDNVTSIKNVRATSRCSSGSTGGSKNGATKRESHMGRDFRHKTNNVNYRNQTSLSALKPSKFLKPWQKSKSDENISNSTKNTFKTCKTIGDFHLVFPFNEITMHCALGCTDIKTIIKECQKQLKERVDNMTEDNLSKNSQVNEPDHIKNPKLNFGVEKQSVGNLGANFGVEKQSIGNLSNISLTKFSAKNDSRTSNKVFGVSSSKSNSKTQTSNCTVSISLLQKSNCKQSNSQANNRMLSSPSHSCIPQERIKSLELWGPLKLDQFQSDFPFDV